MTLATALAAAAGGSACDDGLLGPLGGGGGRVVPWLRVAPPAGQVPHRVVLDATDSTGADLQFRWDFDGDGAYETDYGDDARTEFVYATPGTFHPAVQVRSQKGGVEVRGESDVAVRAVGPAIGAPRTVDIDTDADRDGEITGLDELVEGSVTGDTGVLLLANVDDDDEDGARDGRDEEVTAADEDDLGRAVIHMLRALENGDDLLLRVDPEEARSRVRVFASVDGDWRQIISPEDEPGEGKLSDVVATSGDVQLRIEAVSGRAAGFNGDFTLTAALVDLHDDIVTEDVIAFSISPVIFQDNLQAPQTVYVMSIDNGQDENTQFVGAMLDELDTSIELYTVPAYKYQWDRWMQDNMELGYQAVPDGDSVRTMRTSLQTERGGWGGDLFDFVPNEKLRKDDGFFYPSGSGTSHNYGGNLEVAPPHTVDGEERPFGRLLYGGGTEGTLLGNPSSDTMADDQLAWLNAQGAQAPALELSSEWLAVGHIDEIFQFVPNRAPDAAKPYAVVIASPSLARAVLLDVAARGFSDGVLFAGHSVQTTVQAVLDDEDFLAFNEAAEARIQSIRAKMKAALGLTDADFREVPVLFEDVGERGYDLAVAFDPGVQNLVTAGDRLFLPDPTGPIVDGEDAWRRATRESLADLEMELTFVDVFESYHLLMGEAHCGTNVDREPYAQTWWSHR